MNPSPGTLLVDVAGGTGKPSCSSTWPHHDIWNLFFFWAEVAWAFFFASVLLSFIVKHLSASLQIYSRQSLICVLKYLTLRLWSYHSTAMIRYQKLFPFAGSLGMFAFSMFPLLLYIRTYILLFTYMLHMECVRAECDVQSLMFQFHGVSVFPSWESILKHKSFFWNNCRWHCLSIP